MGEAHTLRVSALFAVPSPESASARVATGDDGDDDVRVVTEALWVLVFAPAADGADSVSFISASLLSSSRMSDCAFRRALQLSLCLRLMPMG